ncbi:WhiB family transcriptional regulator [Tessaracoccus caeni]|uniref:WhiB family transcriptional regulator n=1 Tax=Tessaracoccus caeni TaxID=3031239 RepID=UPI0023DB5F18|nr:WhiB family transcriptional regulator [Tessaracoccus caeni]MDF1489928.1 WhiB family transcriptional regulator [Tessaracoccus caeni]
MSLETTPACVTRADLFLHPFLAETEAPANSAQRRERDMMRIQANALCESCPLLADCLAAAVSRFDVAGFAGGTTRRQRQEIRARLKVSVEYDDLDSYIGMRSSRHFDGREIQRLRDTYPDQPLSVIAAKAGCSISTVKRHLRRAELEGVVYVEAPAPTPREILAVATDIKTCKVQRQAA